MKRCILIATMLIFLTIIKSSGLSNRNLFVEQAISPTYAYAYALPPEMESTPKPIPGTSLTPSLYPNPSPSAMFSAAPTPAPTPSAAPTPSSVATPTPIPAPSAATTPTSTPSATPMPSSVATPTPTPLTTPTPAPSSTPTPLPPAPTPNSVILNPSATLGPLVDILPPNNVDSPEAQNFRYDMNNIISKAEKVSGISSIYGLFIMDLQTNYSYGVNESLTRIDETDNVPEGYFNSASVIKLYQGYIFCDMMRNGELDTEKKWYDKVTGRKFKLMPMVKSMISYSDNNYSNACLRIVDNTLSNAVLNRLGIKNSRLYGEMAGAIGYSQKNNIDKYGTAKRCARLTPMDTALILYNIFINKDSDFYMKELNDALLKNVYNSRIPVGVNRISSKYPIAHKTGTNSGRGIYNDAGIVYAKTPFILVVFTQNTTEKAGNSFIRSISEQVTLYYENK